MFFLLFLLNDKRSISLTNVSGSGRPKNILILRIRIRIQIRICNTGPKGYLQYSKFHFMIEQQFFVFFANIFSYKKFTIMYCMHLDSLPDCFS
jgi:hypothetical protein